MSRLVIIGGSDAGVSATLRARELRPDIDVDVLVADGYPNFSICGLPFLFSGEVSNWQSLAHRTLAELRATGARFRLRTRATRLRLCEREVEALGPDGPMTLEFDHLVIATGAKPMRPPITGLDEEGVHVLHDMGHALGLLRVLRERALREVLIIGAGYIGLEMADALEHAGFSVTVVERASQPMPTVDEPLGELVAERMRSKGIRLATGIVVRRIERERDQLVVRGDRDFEAASPIVLVAAGVVPNAELGLEAGLAEGMRGALRVDQGMRTSVEGVFAAGDCVETWHKLLKRPTYLPLGTTSHKQGRVAGENAVGGNAEYKGSLGTQVVKVFGSVVGRSGLRHDEAKAERFEPLTVQALAWDHKVYFPGATLLSLRVTADRNTRRLLGAQVLGAQEAEVSKRLDLFAMALHHEMRVEQLAELDLSYTPPLSSPWDPVQVAGQDWEGTRREGDDRLAAQATWGQRPPK